MGLGDLKDLLEGLKERDPNLYKQMLGKLKRQMDTPRAPRGEGTKQEPVNIYTTLIRRFTCRHCGNTWETSTQLGKGDAVSWTKDGKCNQIFIVKPKEEPIRVEADAMYCDNCPTFVKGLDRAVVEMLYLGLLKSTGMVRMASLCMENEERKEVRI
uniref:Uncharacterized protein n=1 Tax=viral metagenome TaxID=1070528 RepID=A0A6M3JWM6_9ZZZZ